MISVRGLASVYLLLVSLVSCERAIDHKAIPGQWVLTPEASEMLDIDAKAIRSVLRLRPDGRLEGKNLPGFLVHRAKGTTFSSTGIWRMSRLYGDRIDLTFDDRDVRLRPALFFVERNGELHLAMWLDEPDGTALLFRRVR